MSELTEHQRRFLETGNFYSPDGEKSRRFHKRYEETGNPYHPGAWAAAWYDLMASEWGSKEEFLATQEKKCAETVWDTAVKEGTVVHLGGKWVSFVKHVNASAEPADVADESPQETGSPQQELESGLPQFGESEAKVLSAAITYVDWHLTEAESGEERKSKKQRVVREKQKALDGLNVVAVCEDDLSAYIKNSVSGWSEAKRTILLVEACLAHPFAPYELRFDRSDQARALKNLARLLSLPDTKPEEVLASLKSARKAHKHIAWGKVAVLSVFGAMVVGLGGYIAAPVIAAQLGAAAGLSGAAAVAHGLALLGGGSLAAGGAGMAGGLWLVTGVGATLGGAGLGGGMLLFNLGHAAALNELVKLQVTFHQVVIKSQLREIKAAKIIETLIDQQEELRTQLDHERELNEKNATRLKEIEKLVRAYEDSIRWMKKQEVA